MEFKELKCIFQYENIKCITFIFIYYPKQLMSEEEHEQVSNMRSAVQDLN